MSPYFYSLATLLETAPAEWALFLAHDDTDKFLRTLADEENQ